MPVQVVRSGVIISGHSTISAAIGSGFKWRCINVAAGNYVAKMWL